MNPCGYYYGNGYSNCNTGDIIIPPVVIVPPINQNTCPTTTNSCSSDCGMNCCGWGGMGGMCPMMGGMYSMSTYPMTMPMTPIMGGGMNPMMGGGMNPMMGGMNPMMGGGMNPMMGGMNPMMGGMNPTTSGMGYFM